MRCTNPSPPQPHKAEVFGVAPFHSFCEIALHRSRLPCERANGVAQRPRTPLLLLVSGSWSQLFVVSTRTLHQFLVAHCEHLPASATLRSGHNNNGAHAYAYSFSIKMAKPLVMRSPFARMQFLHKPNLLGCMCTTTKIKFHSQSGLNIGSGAFPFLVTICGTGVSHISPSMLR